MSQDAGDAFSCMVQDTQGSSVQQGNVNKCRILQLVTRNQKFDYEMNSIKLKSVHCTKDLGVRMQGFINRNFAFKIKGVIIALYISLVRLHLEYAVQFVLPCQIEDTAKLEIVQQRATKMITFLHNKSLEERLTRLNLFFREVLVPRQTIEFLKYLRLNEFGCKLAVLK